MDDAHGEAEVLAVLRAVEPRVVQAQVVVAGALEAEVAVLAAQLAKPGQGGSRQAGARAAR